ncbi:DUF202 domain-containing protein [Cellulomonas sp. JH27-2]|uniref:DUF202 domain-containing protein n=1 Tax=Cellulomonas sp. JH27-2 TaxID=2774139 RepID=UPI0017821A9F|nr:DUF202 domain-containing protein [Cellulomonas sp. JH27-2]MBD8059910.1 DUF202 domain-containing protein [Cellulomonas sp. JH27-2]
MSEAGPARHVGDHGLQPHRTELAWRRTSLSLLAVSVAAGKVLEPVLGPASWGLAGLGLVLACALAWGSYHRSRLEVTGARLVTTCAVVTVVLGAGALLYVLTA